jgi:hypothetical protein
VLFPEGGSVRLVARDADARHLAFQQGQVGRGSVRGVTAEAPFLHGVVLEFVPRDLLGDPLVTAETEFVPRENQVVFVLRGMRVVAFHAVSFRRHLVRTARVPRDDIVVAGETDGIHILRKHLPVGGGVRIVAVGAVPCLDRRMDERKFQLLLECFVTGQTDLPLGSGLQTELVLGVRRGNHRHRQDREEEQYGFRSIRHRLSPVIALPRDGNPRRIVRRTERGPAP